jgi:hypothetical protein
MAQEFCSMSMKCFNFRPKKTAAGVDGLPFWLFCDSAEIFTPVVIYVFNIIMRSGIPPLAWKCAIVTPLPKICQSKDFQDLRAISATPFGVRQGSALSPVLFAIYLDELVTYRSNGLYIIVILCADDILMIAQSVNELHKLIAACEVELQRLEISINLKKTCCIRIGPRCGAECLSIITALRHALPRDSGGSRIFLPGVRGLGPRKTFLKISIENLLFKLGHVYAVFMYF